MSFSFLMSCDSTIKNPFKKALLILRSESAFMQTVWDHKSDNEIIKAYDDHLLWQQNFKFLKLQHSSQSTKSKRKFKTFIRPQIEKRKIQLPLTFSDNY